MAADTGKAARGARTTVNQRRCRQLSSDPKGPFSTAQELLPDALKPGGKNG